MTVPRRACPAMPRAGALRLQAPRGFANDGTHGTLRAPEGPCSIYP